MRNGRGDPSNNEGLRAVGVFLVPLIIFLVVVTQFLVQQSLWTDEVTQLTGLSLSLDELFRWLVHKMPNFGVPYDRMPPLSYLVGKIWIYLFGSSVVGLRLLGVTCIAAALLILTKTANDHFGKRGAFFVGLAFALSPNVLVPAIEIRAYPLFILLACVALSLQLQLIMKWRIRTLFQFSVACLLACYTHYFGLVLVLSLWVPLLVLCPREVRMRLFLALMGLAVLSLGLLPFVLAAVDMSSPILQGGSEWVVQVLRLGYRLFGHATIALNDGVIFLLALSIGVLLFFAFKTKDRLVISLSLSLLCGVIIDILAQWMIQGFNALTPSYNVWMIPFFWLLVGSGLNVKRPALRFVSNILALFVIAANLYGAVQLVRYGDVFAHGPYESFAKLIEAHHPNRTAIIYDQSSDHAGMVYFTESYLFKGQLAQYRTVNQFSSLVITPFLSDSPPLTLQDLDKYQYLIFAVVKKQSSKELREYIVSGHFLPSKSRMLDLIAKAPNWKMVESRYLAGWTGIEVWVFKK